MFLKRKLVTFKVFLMRHIVKLMINLKKFIISWNKIKNIIFKILLKLKKILCKYLKKIFKN